MEILRPSSRVLQTLAGLTLLFAVAACGLKGPLRLPEDTEQQSTEQPGEASAATQKKDRANDGRRQESAAAPASSAPNPTQTPPTDR